MPQLCFAYYCSGHGYGHATRVSAFASHLLALNPRPSVHIVSSAPSHIFSDSIALGALYRYAEIDPVIVQPLAYRVDRQRSLDVLQSFLDHKEVKVIEEAQWLKNMNIDCVLSDAAFLAFLAANRASIPSILITNFTFDSVYSYLSAAFIDQSRPHHTRLDAASGLHHVSEPIQSDVPLSEEPLNSLVRQLHDGYRHADMLLRLPGAVPIPSFPREPPLPSPQWIHPISKTFISSIITHLTQNIDTLDLYPSLPFASTHPSAEEISLKPLPRRAHAAPLLVRHANPEVYTQAGRSRFLSSLGVPVHQHDPATTKILVVSFGGQIIHRPSRSRSRSASRPGTPHNPHGLVCSLPENNLSGQLHQSLTALASSKNQRRPWKMPPPLSTPSHIHIPGAPAPALKSPATARLPEFNTVPPTPPIVFDGAPLEGVLDVGDQFLPNESWIAVVCGVSDSKEWRSRSRTPDASDVMNSIVTVDAGNGSEEDLPERFYIAPKDVYMPDLMAVGDVLLGKLGYGTVSECVESCTPFVYVSRPLFIEEHGLRLLLDSEGVGVEMEHEEYEGGNWAVKVAEAWKQGGHAKMERRSGLRVVDRQSQGRAMAQFVVDWVGEWNRQVSVMGSDSSAKAVGS